MPSKKIKGRYTGNWTSETHDDGTIKSVLGKFIGKPPDEPLEETERSEPQIRSDQADQGTLVTVSEISTTPAQYAGPTPAQYAGPADITPAQYAGPELPENTEQPKGFLALPHALSDRIFREISNFPAFKVYLYLYREAFRRVHDDRLTSKCRIALTVLCKNCAISDRGARQALQLLVRDQWITIENQPGASSVYIVTRYLTPAQYAGPTPAQYADDQRNHDLKKDHDFKERRSSSKKATDDDSVLPIKVVYEQLTGNIWTKKDTESYLSLPSNLSSKDVERYVRVIHERTKRPVSSFAYFAKAIGKEQQTPKTRKATLNKLQKVVEAVRTAHTGKSDYSLADLREDVKTAAAQEGIAYTPDMLEQAFRASGSLDR